MGQQSTPPANQLTVLGTLPTKLVGAGYKGDYRNGLYRIFQASGTFIVPTDITKIRVRVLGAGGGGKNNGSGGGGGGYCDGIFTVTPGASYTVTVGAGGTAGASPTAGGTTSFGALLSATGGAAGGAGAAGGTGTGGDFQATGGAAGNIAGSGGKSAQTRSARYVTFPPPG